MVQVLVHGRTPRVLWISYLRVFTRLGPKGDAGRYNVSINQQSHVIG
jgi:hypothetical protein